MRNLATDNPDKGVPILLFVMAFVYATIFGFDYAILAFLIFFFRIAKNFIPVTADAPARLK